jgi:hypothetical protein
MLIAESFFDSYCGFGATQIPGSPLTAHSSKKRSAISFQQSASASAARQADR